MWFWATLLAEPVKQLRPAKPRRALELSDWVIVGTNVVTDTAVAYMDFMACVSSSFSVHKSVPSAGKSKAWDIWCRGVRWARQERKERGHDRRGCGGKDFSAKCVCVWVCETKAIPVLFPSSHWGQSKQNASRIKNTKLQNRKRDMI